MEACRQWRLRVPIEFPQRPPFLPLGSMEDNSVSSSVAKVIRNVSRQSSRQAMPAFHVGITEQAHVENWSEVSHITILARWRRPKLGLAGSRGGR